MHAIRVAYACHTRATNPRRASPPPGPSSPPPQADGGLKLTLHLRQRGLLRVVARQPAPAQTKVSPPQRPPLAAHDPAPRHSDPPATLVGAASGAAIASAVLAGPHGMRSCGQSVGRRSDGFTAGGFAGGRGGVDGGAAAALQQGQPWRGVRWTPPREATAGAAPTDRLEVRLSTRIA